MAAGGTVTARGIVEAMVSWGLGLAWGGVLLCGGLWLWQRVDPWLGLAPLAGAQLVVMVLVLDDLCDRVHRAVAGTLKIAAVTAFWLSAAAWTSGGWSIVWKML